MSSPTSDDYYTRCMHVIGKVLSEEWGNTQLREHLATWDHDDLRALSVTFQAFYKVTRETWIDVVTRPREEQETDTE